MPSETAAEPLILSFDTSLNHCGTALFRGARCLAAHYEDMAKGQAERLMPMIQATLAEAGVDRRQLSAIGVGIGPGNFTGIRISVSAARGLALALGIPAIGVSILEALYERCDSPAICAVTAYRGHVYLQRFAKGAERGPELVALEEISADWSLPGAVVLGNHGEEIAANLGLEHKPAHFAPAAGIASITLRRWQLEQPRPAPLYIRAPDAAPSRETGPRILS